MLTPDPPSVVVIGFLHPILTKTQIGVIRLQSLIACPPDWSRPLRLLCFADGARGNQISAERTYRRSVPAFVLRRWDLEPFPFPQAPLHVHDRGDEGFAVLSGLLDVTLGSEVRRLEPGDFVLVESGTPHTFATVDDVATSVLVAMTPDVDALVRELHEVPEDERASVWAKYGSRMVSPD